jgi:hypothetical protein
VAEAAGFAEVPGDLAGGGGVVEARLPDVRDTVAFGVGAAGAGMPGDVGAEGVGRAEAGALADEDDGGVRVEGEADGIGEGDAGLLGEDDGGETPGLVE